MKGSVSNRKDIKKDCKKKFKKDIKNHFIERYCDSTALMRIGQDMGMARRNRWEAE